MLSRALSLATVTLLIGGLAAGPAYSQATNLEAGKSPSQIFAGTCTACHKGPRGLLKTVPAGSLPNFLRQHYTTSSEMASLLSAFLISNGATDTRYGAGQAKQAKDAKSEGKPGGPEQVDRQGRKLHPGVPPQEAAKPEERPQQAARPDAEEQGVTGRPGRKSAAGLKLGKRGKPGGEEPPKADTAKTEPSAGEPVNEEKPKGEAAREEDSKPGETKPETAKSETAKSDAAKIDAPKAPGSGETPVLRADPVPPVTPAPASTPAATAAVSSGPTEPATPAPSVPVAPPPPPAVTASAPPPAPITPAGPPAPPISR
ncbi:MAG: hypothetical protein E7813_20860 [Bradyrhizobium sp.]|uniref:hypothetical protein n=1 Tax=Bradyrhizobium sp. TaxID=376 RepID=UPI001205C613|nr:hypothetical protein [Bradyrhizobium sp.]THD62105.1 MAG: hypothetical protein E7813_20860 [Bradyrhizobium sp.]